MTIPHISAGKRTSNAGIHGGKVYLAGLVADATVGGPVKDQTADILASINAVLAKAHADKTRILKANIWRTDMFTFQEVNEGWDGW